jgi:hypothetical protein
MIQIVECAHGTVMNYFKLMPFIFKHLFKVDHQCHLALMVNFKAVTVEAGAASGYDS